MANNICGRFKVTDSKMQKSRALKANQFKSIAQQRKGCQFGFTLWIY
jgi:hypothetical protein